MDTSYTDRSKLTTAEADHPQVVGPEPSRNGHEPKNDPDLHFTDVGNGKRFYADHGADSHFCFPWNKWLFWTGKKWKVDDTGEAYRRAKATIKKLFDDASREFTQATKTLKAAHPDDQSTTENAKQKIDNAKKLTEFAKKSEDVKKIEAMLKLARSEGTIPILPNQLDTDHYLLNCQNGTVDLRTGERRPHRREDLITKITPGNFNPDATCHLWLKTIDQIHNHDRSVIGFMQRYLGYGATGSVKDELTLICHGAGSNGKTVELETIAGAEGVLGPDYAGPAAPDLILKKKGERHPTELADLHGKRLLLLAETEDGRELSVALFKRLTGKDTINARRCKEDFWSFFPTHKFIIPTNHRPKIKDPGHATWRRLAFVPYEVKFWKPGEEPGKPELQANPDLQEQLKAEHEGILAWLVSGAGDWFRNGMQVPDKILTATKGYRAEEDRLTTFTGDCCLTGSPDYRIRGSALYNAYLAWCESNGEEHMDSRSFGIEMENRFEKKTSNGVWYLGITLIPPQEDGEENA